MIGEVCAEIKNYFTYDEDKHFGRFVISDGLISPTIDLPTAYIRIKGSRLNDGVHKVSEMQLQDEEFDGSIWVMSPPAGFLSLLEEIEDWQKKNGSIDSAAMSPFYSESFGGYSYSKSAGSVSGKGTSTTWQNAYANRLNMYRRIIE